MQSQNIYFLILLIKVLILHQSRYGSTDSGSELYHKCGNTFSCGSNITGIGYPFRRADVPEYCGHPNLVLSCDERNNVTNIDIMNLKYRVLEMDPISQTMRIAREDTMRSVCPTEMVNTTLDYSVFDLAASCMNYTFFYGCDFPPNFLSPISCGGDRGGAYVLPGAYGPNDCDASVVVLGAVMAASGPGPINTTEFGEALEHGFQIRWKVEGKSCGDCTASRGRCGYDSATNRTTCYCRDPPYASDVCAVAGFVLSPESKRKHRAKEIITIVSSVGISGVIIVSITICCFLKRRQRSQNGPKRKCKRDVENLLFQHESLAPKRYRYSDIKKITKSLSEKLGQGGFGSVYKGMLPDGRLVAVKILSEIIDSNGEEFINEVASISKTSHVNIVSLLGFCYEGNKSALVYEYMPNKSLDKFLGHDEDGLMDLKKLYKIAVGIAKGLEYLHTGCTTRIVHFDIKPQNILLDDDLCPKISDFGMAKLCKKKQSVLSVLGTRGTVGYIAPEVFSRNFGAVSHKSDVYSYGMMLLEMAGARKNVGIQVVQVQSKSENYFPDKIYDQVVIDVTSNLDDESRMIEEEEEERRKMMLIGFWCIQTIPSERPSMSKVVEMLEGSLESVQIPPKPFLFSPVNTELETSSSFSASVETENIAGD